jgi:hypothetical protein
MLLMFVYPRCMRINHINTMSVKPTRNYVSADLGTFYCGLVIAIYGKTTPGFELHDNLNYYLRHSIVSSKNRNWVSKA